MWRQTNLKNLKKNKINLNSSWENQFSSSYTWEVPVPGFRHPTDAGMLNGNCWCWVPVYTHIYYVLMFNVHKPLDTCIFMV